MEMLGDRGMLEPGRIMTDFFVLSTKNDIDNNYIDIDIILCFNAEHWGGDAPSAAGHPS
jgi:hypothetical protein